MMGLFGKGERGIKLKVITGLVLTLFLIGMLTLAFNIQPVRASETIYIRADGSVEPEGTPISSIDNITYTFTGNINEPIVIERDNIVVDGTGYTIQGTGSGDGIDLSHRSNVTIKKTTIKNFTYGIYLESSLNNTISANNIKANKNGIYLGNSSNNNVFGNNITKHLDLEVFTGTGISLGESDYNIVSGNNITNNWEGIYMKGSNHNILSNNIIINNVHTGISVDADNNTISSNYITENHHGIYLFGNDNIINNNNITNNYRGIFLSLISGNKIYHNNFINNSPSQVYVYMPPHPPNTWDDGYPSGGNYWSDYAGADVKSGPNQDQPSSDGIGDTAYVIDANNRDNYPLMYPWGSPPPPSYNLTIYSSPTGVNFTVDGVSRTTPWSGTYSEGASVILVMPETHDGYTWSHWLEDVDTNRTKTVTMNTNTTLTGNYWVPPPVGGNIVPVNKLELLMPYIGVISLILVTITLVVKKRRIKLY